MRKFWFDGHCCEEFGIVCSGSGTFAAPERDATVVDIPGRNGTLTMDNGRYKNVTITYPAAVPREFSARAAAIRAWLLGPNGYRRLEDEYQPDCYRMARFAGPLEFDAGFLNRSASMSLAFDCMPQRWLKSGEYAQPIANGQALCNPTGFEALPLIEVDLTGEAAALQVGEVTVQFAGYTGLLVLDCDLQDAYEGTSNLNRYVTAAQFPVLPAGKTEISWSGGVSSVRLTPNWWTL